MEKDKHKCVNCGSDMVIVDMRVIGGTTYNIFKCEKCRRQAAKTAE